MYDQDTGRWYRVAIGGGVGFFLGIVAILALGVLGMAAPILGLIIGVAAGAMLSRREARGFCLGYIATGMTVFLIAQLLLNLAPGASQHIQGIWHVSGMFGNGSALIGSVFGAVLAEHFAPSDERSSSLRIFLLAVPMLLLGVCVLGMGLMAGDTMLK